mmetsp:Transcript_115636/g.210314  ORF Transcript_115636/g.210314 Transcript_115636/m.210314 type:complete len:400 (-) Transcript_115636:105-1304(-)
MLLVLSRLTLWGIAIGASTADPLTCSWVGLCAVEEGLQMLQTTARKNGPALHSDDSSVQNQEKTKSEPGRKLTSLAGNSSSLGVVYSICGDTMYWNELSDSIATVTEKENVSITVFTLPGEMHKCKGLASRFGIKCVDAFKSIKQMSPKTSRLGDAKQKIIDQWHELALHGLESRILKISSILLSPYHYSLFLDSDTHMCEPLNQLAVRLGDLTNFDMLGALNHLGTLRPYDGKSADAYKKENGIPEAYKEINTGVLFVHTDRIQVLEFVAEWMLEYMKMDGNSSYSKTNHSKGPGKKGVSVPDQPSFMKVLWQSEVEGSLRFYGLPPQWNMKNWRSSLKWQDYGHSKDVVEISDKDWPDVSLQEHSLLGDSCCPRVKMDSKGRSPDLPVLIDHACKSK